MQEAQVWSLVRELDPTGMPQLRVRVPQLRSPHAATKEPACRNQDPVQPNKYFLKMCVCIYVLAIFLEKL